jgi:hypothetical protein
VTAEELATAAAIAAVTAEETTTAAMATEEATAVAAIAATPDLAAIAAMTTEQATVAPMATKQAAGAAMTAPATAVAVIRLFAEQASAGAAVSAEQATVATMAAIAATGKESRGFGPAGQRQHQHHAVHQRTSAHKRGTECPDLSHHALAKGAIGRTQEDFNTEKRSRTIAYSTTRDSSLGGCISFPEGASRRGIFL